MCLIARLAPPAKDGAELADQPDGLSHASPLCRAQQQQNRGRIEQEGNEQT
jgi:hypothetical protein